MTIDYDLAFAARLADAAGAVVRPQFRSSHIPEHKADWSLVTATDRAAEAAMRQLIEAEFPRDGIIGEEYGTSTGTTGRSWVLDPIDGTVSFIAGRPIFGTLIALIEDGWPVLGVIDQPIARERWVGAVGRPTLFNGTPARTRHCRALADVSLATSSPHYFKSGTHVSAYLAVAGSVDRDRIVYGGDCYNYGLLASGHLDLVIESGLKLHDFAALVPVVEGAGGTLCDWVGQPLHAGSTGDVIALGDPARLDDIIALLSRAVEPTISRSEPKSSS